MSETKQKGFPFGMGIIAIVLGSSIFREFDFERYTFEKPALAAVYIFAFLLAVFFIVNHYRGK